MDFREEIEKLSVKPFWDNYGETHRQFLEKSDVLSILDEHLGEEIARWIANDELSNVPAGIRESFRPGDEVSIYVRRKK